MFHIYTWLLQDNSALRTVSCQKCVCFTPLELRCRVHAKFKQLTELIYFHHIARNNLSCSSANRASKATLFVVMNNNSGGYDVVITIYRRRMPSAASLPNRVMCKRVVCVVGWWNKIIVTLLTMHNIFRILKAISGHRVIHCIILVLRQVVQFELLFYACCYRGANS